METIKRFEDIECWQVARILVQQIYELTRKEGFRKDFELVNQIRRSAVSSMANIEEGFHHNSRKNLILSTIDISDHQLLRMDNE